jgi:hypothetical protein
MFKTRVCTKTLIEMIDEGVITADKVVEMCLNYMSEADVQDMMEANDLWGDEDE